MNMRSIFNNFKVAVCIITFNRPSGLERLLISLQELHFLHMKEPNWKIIIVDNDPTMPNQSLIDSFRKIFNVPIYYEKEKTRGIASARNRCVELAVDVDFIAFVDDDETVSSTWLDELLLTQTTYNADVVLGPVIINFEEPPPAWFIRGKFLEREKHATGDDLNFAYTGNVLIKKKWLTMIAGPFNEKLNLSGAEDSLFFRQIYQLGAKIIWSNEASIIEIYPPERTTIRYLTKRKFRIGNTRTQINILLDTSWKTLIFRVVLWGFQIFKSLLLLVPMLIKDGFVGFLKVWFNFCEGLGGLLGMLGIRYKIYNRVKDE